MDVVVFPPKMQTALVVTLEETLVVEIIMAEMTMAETQMMNHFVSRVPYTKVSVSLFKVISPMERPSTWNAATILPLPKTGCGIHKHTLSNPLQETSVCFLVEMLEMEPAW